MPEIDIFDLIEGLEEQVEEDTDELKEAPPVQEEEPSRKTSYEEVHRALTVVYHGLQQRMEYGPQWVKAWDKARVNELDQLGWTEEEFYSEMKRRSRDERKC